MKKHYLLVLPFALIMLFNGGCSKDFLKRYEKRIVGGTWNLDNIHSSGVGGWNSFPFNNGSFTFMDGGRLEYTDLDGNFYEGSWDIGRVYLSGEDRETHTLQISVVNFQTQDLLSEYFDEIVFTGTNRFVGHIYTNSREYRFVFKR